MFDITRNAQSSLSQFMYKVYAWMAAGLAITAGTAYGLFQIPSVSLAIIRNQWLFILLAVVQIGLAIILSAMIKRLSYVAAASIFVLYTALLGITLSVIFFVYQLGSIGTIFGVTAMMFAVMAFYGYFTKADLTGTGSILTMGLLGIIIASVINLFLRNSMLDIIISMIAVVIFVGLTAYDVQRIKNIAADMTDSGQIYNRIAVLGALILFLDFVNLFLVLLNLFGTRKK